MNDAALKLRSVQVLRGLAVLMVVLHHYGSIAVGAAGVDLFFVISGFIMVKVMPGRTPFGFARDRLLRIVPVLWAATAFHLLVLGQPLDASRLTDSALLVPGGDYYLPQSWTLMFELTFYAGCVAYLAFGRIALLIIPAAFLLGSGPYAGIITSALFAEFLLGCIVAKLPRSGWWAIVAAGASFYAFNGQDRSLAYGIPSAFLLWGGISLESCFRRWAEVPVLIGDASYSIYLTHWTFVAILPVWPVPGSWLVNAYLSVLIGLAFYFAVERPIINIRRIAMPLLLWTLPAAR